MIRMIFHIWLATFYVDIRLLLFSFPFNRSDFNLFGIYPEKPKTPYNIKVVSMLLDIKPIHL
jgi:hypothetical protein